MVILAASKARILPVRGDSFSWSTPRVLHSVTHISLPGHFCSINLSIRSTPPSQRPNIALNITAGGAVRDCLPRASNNLGYKCTVTASNQGADERLLSHCSLC